ncbi:tumor necrosis factor receptor superfamily member 6-like [Choloepus didactylus]|uniref:tumor necrosis factor receptor superfamily member 6-like n=1 Tax=Choloepus didactylus TaxID=27675 RepID=UPI00189F8C24|nr:tumor necrosis factor receptor superfamily member 6-like [Choloepus didactylus]
MPLRGSADACRQAALCALGPRRPGLTLAGGGLGLGPEALQGLERSVGLWAPPPGAPAWGTRGPGAGPGFRQMRTMFALAALSLPLLLLRVQMTATPAPPHLIPTGSREAADPLGCGPHEYWTAGRCCRPCPPGQRIGKHCSVTHSVGECVSCESGTFSDVPNEDTSCRRCTRCRTADQEMVAECSLTSDRHCQCRTGSFYCDSPAECPESCFRCSRCLEDTVPLWPCNATRDTVCGPAHPGSGNRNLLWICVIVPLSFLTAGLWYCHRKGRLRKWVIGYVKRQLSAPGPQAAQEGLGHEVPYPKALFACGG